MPPPSSPSGPQRLTSSSSILLRSYKKPEEGTCECRLKAAVSSYAVYCLDDGLLRAMLHLQQTLTLDHYFQQLPSHPELWF